MGGGVWLKDAGRGSQKSGDPVIEKPFTAKDAKER
jgi:hypothetical protein